MMDAGLKRPPGSESSSGNPANIQLENVRLIWLEGPAPEPAPAAEPAAEPAPAPKSTCPLANSTRFLLLEDTDTGDILLPLLYMRSILESNYSRKLATLKYREVQIPAGHELVRKQGLLHWHWAFECPPVIKLMVRHHLSDSKPQGHMRLVLLPIVYNAMADRKDLRSHPLFVAMDREMRRSSYWPLVSHPPFLPVVQTNPAAPSEPVFHGPKDLTATIAKYMFLFPSLEEVEHSKRLRTTFVDTQIMQRVTEESGGPQFTDPMMVSMKTAKRARGDADWSNDEYDYGDEATTNITHKEKTEDTPEDLAGAKGLFDMLINGHRNGLMHQPRPPQGIHHHHDQQQVHQRHQQHQQFHQQYPGPYPQQPATYNQMIELQNRVYALHNDVAFLKTSMLSILQLLQGLQR